MPPATEQYSEPDVLEELCCLSRISSLDFGRDESLQASSGVDDFPQPGSLSIESLLAKVAGLSKQKTLSRTKNPYSRQLHVKSSNPRPGRKRSMWKNLKMQQTDTADSTPDVTLPIHEYISMKTKEYAQQGMAEAGWSTERRRIHSEAEDTTEAHPLGELPSWTGNKTQFSSSSAADGQKIADIYHSKLGISRSSRFPAQSLGEPRKKKDKRNKMPISVFKNCNLEHEMSRLNL